MNVWVRRMCTDKKRFLWLMLIPVLFVVSRIPVIRTAGQVISCALYLVINFLFALLLGMLFCKSKNKIEKIPYAVFMVMGGTVLDQIIKLFIHKFDVKVNIVGKYLAVKERKNMHQMAMLNFSDVTLDVEWILLIKVLVTFLMIAGYLYYRKKNQEGAFGFLGIAIAGVTTILDTVCWGYTLDYVYFYGLVSYDLKDFIANIACGYVIKAGLEQDLKKHTAGVIGKRNHCGKWNP